MSERCATCRWWREVEEDGEGRDWYVLESLKVRDPRTHEPVELQPFAVRFCTAPKVRFYERPEQDGAAVVDGSEYWAALATGPDFGCVHHEGQPS